jgi:ParB/RepB/Spo0J family partition protein
MKQKTEPQSPPAASSSLSAAAAVGRKAPLEIQPSAPDRKASTDRAAAAKGKRPVSISNGAARSVPNQGSAPIGGAEMTKIEASVESRTATASPPAAAPVGRAHRVDASQAAPAENSEVQLFQTVEVPTERLVEAAWNPNRVPARLLAKLRRSVEEFGIVENLVARPHPDGAGQLEVVSGNHRLRIYRELGLSEVPVVVVELADAQARLLAQALNRTRGTDDPKAYAELLERLLQDYKPAALSEFLPESEATIERHLREFGQDADQEASALAPPAEPRSRLGELYELGPHRLLCGDATDPDQVARLLGDEQVTLLVTDPPYGVGVDHSWRDGVRQPAGSARTATLLNDDRADWRDAYSLSRAQVAYVWHSALHAGEVFEGLQEAGFEVRQQIIWVKQIHALSRSHYQWKHEPCWYAVRKGTSASWDGGRKQTTVWEDASPIAGYGGGSDEDTATAHPTQKPLSLYTRPILNHTKPGQVIYDPFGGSGTALIAAEKHGRRCLMIELDPAWCDVIRDRYHALIGKDN